MAPHEDRVIVTYDPATATCTVTLRHWPGAFPLDLDLRAVLTAELIAQLEAATEEERDGTE